MSPLTLYFQHIQPENKIHFKNKQHITYKMSKDSSTTSSTSSDEHFSSADEPTQQRNNDISCLDSDASSGDEITMSQHSQYIDAKVISRLKARRKKQKQRVAKSGAPLAGEKRESNRKACAKYRESLNSGSESDKRERAQSKQRNKCALTDEQREGNRKACAKYRESLSSGSESDKQERAQTRQRNKCPLTDKQRETNRKACAKYRESLSSGSETDKQDLRAKATQRQRKRRDSASESEKETLRQNEGEDLQSRNRRLNSKNVCRFCHQEGHMQPLSIRSCPNFCTYCQLIAHNVKQCKNEKADAIRGPKMNQDAKNYQVIDKASYSSHLHNPLLRISSFLF